MDYKILQLRESLREGLYHEIGHSIATLIYFHHDQRLQGITFTKKSNGGYGLETSISSLEFKSDMELSGITMIAFSGAVFQQMVYLYRALNKKENKYNVKERLVSKFNKRKALQQYFERNVMEFIDGMEIDMSKIVNIYRQSFTEGKINYLLDKSKAKDEAIELLMPFVSAPEVEALCEHCLDVFVDCGMKGGEGTLVGTDIIESYIANLIEETRNSIIIVSK